MKKLIKAGLNRGIFLIVPIIFFSFAGCSSSPSLIEIYPDFMISKDHVSSISICTDVLVVYDGVEPGVVIDIPLSVIVGDSILSIFKAELEKKNYQIGEIYPTAVGYSLGGDEKHYRVFETNADYSLSTDSLKMIPAPFLLEDKFLEAEDLLSEIEDLPAALSAADSSGYRDREREGQYLLYLYLDAQNVSLTKRIGEGLLISIISLGTVTASPEASASASYQLYNLQTGKVVLSDGRTMTGPDLTGENVADLLEDILEEIPARNP